MENPPRLHYAFSHISAGLYVHLIARRREIIGARIPSSVIIQFICTLSDVSNNIIIAHSIECCMITKFHFFQPGKQCCIGHRAQLFAKLSPKVRAKLFTRKTMKCESSPK